VGVETAPLSQPEKVDENGLRSPSPGTGLEIILTPHSAESRHMGVHVPAEQPKGGLFPARLTGLLAALVLVLSLSASAYADPSPTGSPGQPGAPGTTCGSSNATSTPGNSSGANGSPFNPNGTTGTVYAGNPGTASQANANSTHAVSQYDIACFEVTPHR
jgi:hypothetical protein